MTEDERTNISRKNILYFAAFVVVSYICDLLFIGGFFFLPWLWVVHIVYMWSVHANTTLPPRIRGCRFPNVVGESNNVRHDRFGDRRCGVVGDTDGLVCTVRDAKEQLGSVCRRDRGCSPQRNVTAGHRLDGGTRRCSARRKPVSNRFSSKRSTARCRAHC